MLTLVIYCGLALVVAAVIVSVLVVVLPDDTVASAPRDMVPAGLPAREDIGADDVNRLRLPVALRGYRMTETDAVLDRLGAELERRDKEIATLRAAQDGRPLYEPVDSYPGSAIHENAQPTVEPGIVEAGSPVTHGSDDPAPPVALTELGETPEESEATDPAAVQR